MKSISRRLFFGQIRHPLNLCFFQWCPAILFSPWCRNQSFDDDSPRATGLSRSSWFQEKDHFDSVRCLIVGFHSFYTPQIGYLFPSHVQLEHHDVKLRLPIPRRPYLVYFNPHNFERSWAILDLGLTSFDHHESLAFWFWWCVCFWYRWWFARLWWWFGLVVLCPKPPFKIFGCIWHREFFKQRYCLILSHCFW